MATKAYKLSKNGKAIIIDDTVKLTDTDKADIAMYLAAGKVIRHKSEERAAKAIERAAKNNVTKEEIAEALKKDAAAKKYYDTIMTGKGKGTGYFAAKNWFIKQYLTGEWKKEK